jgi:hypothetical protein
MPSLFSAREKEYSIVSVSVCVPSCSLHQVINDESAERRIRNIASVAHQAPRLTELVRTRIPGHTTATFRSFEPESGVPSQVCSCRSCKYKVQSQVRSQFPASWHRNLMNSWWLMTPITFAAYLIVQGSAILISLAHTHSELPAFPEDNRFELAGWRFPADWWSRA